MALSIGIALVGGGIAAVMHNSSDLLMSASLFVPIAINIVGLPQALEEHWTEAALAVILLPIALFLYAVGVCVMRQYHPEVGYLFIALGLAAFGMAARPAPTRAGAPHGQMAEQH
jgi:hypothetical protein